MIFYPIFRLKQAGITEILIVTGRLGFPICGLVVVLSLLLFLTAHSIWQFILGAISFGALYTAILLFLPANELEDVRNYGLQLIHMIRRR